MGYGTVWGLEPQRCVGAELPWVQSRLLRAAVQRVEQSPWGVEPCGVQSHTGRGSLQRAAPYGVQHRAAPCSTVQHPTECSTVQQRVLGSCSPPPLQEQHRAAPAPRSTTGTPAPSGLPAGGEERGACGQRDPGTQLSVEMRRGAPSPTHSPCSDTSPDPPSRTTRAQAMFWDGAFIRHPVFEPRARAASTFSTTPRTGQLFSC